MLGVLLKSIVQPFGIFTPNIDPFPILLTPQSTSDRKQTKGIALKLPNYECKSYKKTFKRFKSNLVFRWVLFVTRCCGKPANLRDLEFWSPKIFCMSPRRALQLYWCLEPYPKLKYVLFLRMEQVLEKGMNNCYDHFCFQSFQTSLQIWFFSRT